MLPIIDTHQHLWDLEKFNLPWLDSVPSLNRSYISSDYLAATQEIHIVKAIYMEVDVRPDQRVAEVEYISRLCQYPEYPTCAAVIAGSPGTADFEEYINQFQGNPYVKGVRQVLHVPECPQGYCLEPAFVAGVQLLGELDLSFDICMRPRELADGVQLARLCSDTTLILDHCGNADPNIVAGSAQPSDDNSFGHTREQWMADISALAACPNVICKISGIVARANEGWQPQDLAPTIDHCLDTFGPDRVIFGGDWPVCKLGASYFDWATALLEIIRPRRQEEQHKLLHDNAVRIYNL